MSVTMDVNEHGASDKKGVFVDARILALRHTGQIQNPLS